MIDPRLLYRISVADAATQPESTNKGLYCTPDGLYYGSDIPLVRRNIRPDGLTQTAITPQREIEASLTKALGSHVDFTDRMTGLRTVAQALEQGNLALASIAAVQLRSPDLPNEAPLSRPVAPKAFTKYNPNWPTEPRDWHGRWTTEGTGAPVSTDGRATGEAAYVIPAAYNGRYHDFVVDDFLQYLRKNGLVAEKEISLYRLDGAISAKADILVLNSQMHQLEIVEIKTGDDPQYTPNQRQIYPLAMVGGHVYTNDPRISEFGYDPGQLLPPMKGWSLYAPGPGKEISITPLLLEFE